MKTRQRSAGWGKGWLLALGAALAGTAPAAAQGVTAHTTGAGGPAVVPGPAGSATDAERALHLLSRATWGVRPADLVLAESMGPERWLERQLEPSAIADVALEARPTAFPTTLLSMSELYVQFSPQPGQQQELARLQALRDSLGEQAVQGMLAELRRGQQARSPARLLNELVGAKVQRAVYSERQLEDVMTDFWFNHFNVFFNKGQDRYLIGDYERAAIRPHVFGRFEDMLLATAQHPAMLFYLDNWRSVWADPARQQVGQNLEALLRRLGQMTPEQKEQLVRSGRVSEEQLAALARGELRAQRIAQAARARGLNENYARELMELHTLGVDGGYTQQDVIEVARAFTGWTFQPYNPRQLQMQDMQPAAGRPGALRPPPGPSGRGTGARSLPPGRAAAGGAPPARGAREAQARAYVGPGDVPFVFRPADHDPGEKSVLGTRLPAGRGMEDGLDVIRLLSRHPSTARHLATKLVERFVSDDPPAELVAELAEVFLRSDGDLKQVTRALFTAEAFYAPEHRRAKVKTPFELVVSALRASGADVGPSQPLVNTLRTMGHLPYTEPAPTGFPTMSEDWVNTGAMLARMTFGLDLAAGRVNGARPDPELARRGAADPAALLEALMPGVENSTLAARIAAELDAQALPPRQRAQRALGLALGSPEFQRR